MAAYDDDLFESTTTTEPDAWNTTFVNQSSNPTSAGLPEVVSVSIVVAILSIVTSGGNLLVLISFKMDRQLQTVSNYFLLSLAVADFAIGIVSMPLYTVLLLMKRWPLGPVVCDAWLSLDYTMSNASVANLLIISFDRYFSVMRPLTYRVRRTPRKAAMLIAVAWIVSVVMWTPWIWTVPYMEGQRHVPDDDCYIQFLETNAYMTVITAVAAFYLPVMIMCVLYFNVYLATERRQQELAYLQPVVMAQCRQLSMRPQLMTSSSLPPALTPTASGGDQSQTLYQPGSAPTRRRWLIWNAPTPSIEPLDPSLLSPGCMSVAESTPKDITPSPGICWSTQSVKPTLGSTKNYQTMPLPSRDEHKDGSSRSLLEFCKMPQNLSSNVYEKQHSEDFCAVVEQKTDNEASPADDNDAQPSALLTPLSAELLLPLTPSRDQSPPPLPPQLPTKDTDGVKSSVSLSLKLGSRSNISVIDEETSSDRSSAAAAVVVTAAKPFSEVDGNRANLNSSTMSVSSHAQNQLQQRRRHQEKKQERKAAKTLSAILLAFIVTWTPYNVIIIVKAFTDVDADLYSFSYWLCYLNSTVNPVLYALCNANFRRTYWRILTCRWVKRHAGRGQSQVPMPNQRLRQTTTATTASLFNRAK